MNATQPNLDIKLNEPEATTVETTEIVASTPSTALVLIQAAVDKGLSAETVEKLYALHERISDRFEARSFNLALTKFQATCPIVPLGGENKSLTDSGTGKYHRYARLEQDILPTVSGHLHNHGFSWTWDTETYKDSVKVTCTLRHIDGHQCSASFGVPLDDRANRATSPAQKFGNIETYCRRLSFIQVTGIRVGDPDTDATPGAKISTDQSFTIESLITESGADRVRFLKFMKTDSIESIPASEYDRAINCLNEKKRKAAG